MFYHLVSYLKVLQNICIKMCSQDILKEIALKQSEVEKLQQQRASLSKNPDSDLTTLLAGIQDVEETTEELCATKTQWLDNAEQYDDARRKVEEFIRDGEENLDKLETDELMPTQEKLDNCKVSYLVLDTNVCCVNAVC